MRPLGHARTMALPAAVMLMIAGAALPLAAQEPGSIQGTVVGQASGRAMEGAQVYIRGTNVGTLTNSSGHYVLRNLAPGSYRVTVHLIGYSDANKTVTVSAGTSTTLDFQLTASAVNLNEIVVTGTAATARKKELGNSTDVIAASQIENAPVANVEDVLQGRGNDVTIMSNSGQPGSGGTIKIRGVNTVSQSVQPLIYVDGVRIANDQHRAGWGGRTSTNPLQDIPAEDIARVEVVKGAAATTLYGTEAAGGVIQIFTKKGEAGQARWSAKLSTGTLMAPHFGKNDPTQFYTKCGNLANLYGVIPTGSDAGQRLYFQDPTCPSDGDWQRPGFQGSGALSVRGGGEDLTYYASGNYSSTDGYLPTSWSKDGGFRANFAFTPSDPLKLSLSSAYQRRDTRWVADGNNAGGFLLDVGRGPFGYMQGGQPGDCVDVASDKRCITNGYVFGAQNYTRSHHFISSLELDYKPSEAFVHRLTVGWDYEDIFDNTTRPFGNFLDPSGYYWPENTTHKKLSLDYSGSWNTDLTGSITSSLSWGGQLFRDWHHWTETDATGFAGPGEPTIESGAAITYVRDRPFAGTNAGFFLQELIGFQDRLFLTGGLRVDGNSAFGTNFGLQAYPKAQLSWVLSDYDFFPKGGIWDTFKLRAALGQSGKAPGAFDKLRTWTPVSGENGQAGFAPDNVGNADLGPERTTEYEAGFDAGFLAGRVGLEFTAFRSETKDGLVPVNLPPSQGFLSDRTENVGSLRNEGLEGSLDVQVLDKQDLRWSLRFSGSVLRSKVLDLGPGSVQNPTAHMIYTGLNSYMKVGHSAPAYYGYEITNPDAYADPNVITDSLSEIGPVFPTRELSISTSLRVMGNLRLDALMAYQGGFYQQNYTGYQSARRGAWFPCLGYQEAFLNGGDVSGYTAMERARCAPNGTSLYDISWWTEKGDFWKLRSVSLTYDLPSKILPWTRRTSITLAGRNLLVFTDYTGTDPEVTDSADHLNLVGDAGRFGRRDYYQIPPGRTLVLTLRTSF